MKTRLSRLEFFALAMVSAGLMLGSAAGLAQAAPGHQHAATNATVDVQLDQLRMQVAELARIVHSHGPGSGIPGATMQGMGGMPAGSPGPGMQSPGMGMGMMNGMRGSPMQSMGGSGMGMMGMEMMNMKGMGTGNVPAMNGPSGGGMGMMDMMGQMHGMGAMSGSGMAMPSALPGFPGASHLYHVGATGFFLDHPEHITLSAEQQTALNRTKEQALLRQSTTQRKVADAEQELWKLTSADQPDGAKIDAKVREIEKLRGDQRLAFIQAIGEAAKVLTDEQRKAVLGDAAQSGHSGH